jgi:hypothetical protein
VEGLRSNVFFRLFTQSMLELKALAYLGAQLGPLILQLASHAATVLFQYHGCAITIHLFAGLWADFTVVDLVLDCSVSRALTD